MRSTLIASVLAAALLACGTRDARALTIHYDGSGAPSAIAPNPMSFHVGSGTTWAAAGGELTLNTVYAHVGIWFGNGNHVGSLAVPWQVGTNADGNYLKVRARLSAGADVWSIYLLDRTHTAGFTLYQDRLTWGHAGGGGQMSFDPTAYHTYEFLLKDGLVTYRLDESQILYQGPASGQSFSTGIFVIGDGSGSDLSGVGSMIVDDVLYVSEPAFQIPEPASATLLAAAATAAAMRRSRRSRR